MLQYESVGNYPAPSFFNINETTGIITVARPLTEDSLQTPEYKVWSVENYTIHSLVKNNLGIEIFWSHKIEIKRFFHKAL